MGFSCNLHYDLMFVAMNRVFASATAGTYVLFNSFDGLPALAPILASGLCWLHIGVPVHTGSMHRLTARLLLFVALVGNLVPLALAATAAPPHACCVRKAAHHCHDSSISESAPLLMRDSGCCSHDCCRAVTTARWAQAQPPAAASFAQIVETYVGQSNPVYPNTEVCRFQSTRAPPHLSIA